MTEPADPERADAAAPANPESSGWPFVVWVYVYAVALVVAISFGTAPKTKGDQPFLLAVIALQALVGTVMVRILAAVFKWKSALGFVGKIIAMAMLALVLFLLTVCSSMVRTGWLGG